MRLKLFAAISTMAIFVDVAGADARALTCGPYSHAVVRSSWHDGHRYQYVSCVGNVRRVHAVPYHRSWKKSALVIGGATAAGAGAGALIGGGKGAAIGAAAGAGAGTIYEVHKRRKHRRHY